MKVDLLSREAEPLWREFVAEHPHAMFYHSLDYRDLLTRVLGATQKYLIATDGGRCCGVLPAFLSADKGAGTVLNSLPFYGSNGGCLSGSPQVVDALLKAYLDVENDAECVASTLVSSPFDNFTTHYDAVLLPDCHDDRVGQLTVLPHEDGASEDRLFDLYDESARRNVRKARKAGVSWSVESDPSNLEFLATMHAENIHAVGGLPKNRDFFYAAWTVVSAECRRLYVAHLDGLPIAALLVFRSGCATEYFTPAIRSEFRSFQPLALLVHEAMREATADGFRFWNWGGTWATQVGVYRFKKKWGAADKPYRYFTRLRNPAVLNFSRGSILSAFPGFYVLPFNRLPAESGQGRSS